MILRTHMIGARPYEVIPTLSVETDPRTIIVTVDDDLDYPPHVNRALVSSRSAATRLAIGLKGRRLPPTNTTVKDKCDPRTWDHVLQERDYGYYSHENLLYTDAASRTATSRSTCWEGCWVWLIDPASICDGWWTSGPGPAGACLWTTDWISSVLIRCPARRARFSWY